MLDTQNNSSGHVILGGAGELGLQIAKLLRAQGLEVIVIDIRDDAMIREDVESLGCQLVVSDIIEALPLPSVNIAQARCVILTTVQERVNLQAAIKARRLNAQAPIVARLFDEVLVRHTEKIFNIYPLSSPVLVSPAIVSAATGIALLAELEINDHILMLYEGEHTPGESRGIHIRAETVALADEVEDASLKARIFHMHDHAARRQAHQKHLKHERPPWAGLHPLHLWRRLHEIWRRSSAITRRLVFTTIFIVILSTIIFAVGDHLKPLDALYFVVTTITTVGYGDINLQQASPLLKVYGILLLLAGAALLANLYTLLADYVMTSRMEYLLGRRQLHLRGHVVVVGLGDVGSRVAHDLHRLGVEVVGIEQDETVEGISAMRALFPVIIGNANRRSVLHMAAIEQATVVITTTQDPMLNLSVALHAREAHHKIRVIVLTHDAALAETFTGLGFNYVLSTATIAAPSFIHTALYPGVKASFCHGNQDILIARMSVTPGSLLENLSVRDVGDNLGMTPLLDTNLHFLKPESVLQAGDEVFVLLTEAKADLLRNDAGADA